MGSKDQKQGGGFFSSIASGISNFGTAMHKSVNGLIGYEGLEVINPEGGTKDAEEEAQRGRWTQEMLEYSQLLDLADECEDPYMRMVYASESSSSNERGACRK